MHMDDQGMSPPTVADSGESADSAGLRPFAQFYYPGVALDRAKKHKAQPRPKRTIVWNVQTLCGEIGWDVRELHKRSGIPRESLDRMWAGTSKIVALANLERLRDALGLEHVGLLFTYVVENSEAAHSAPIADAEENRSAEPGSDTAHEPPAQQADVGGTDTSAATVVDAPEG